MKDFPQWFFEKAAWQEKTLDEISIKIGSGKTPKGGANVYRSSGIFFIRSQNVFNGELNFDDIVYISKKIDDEMKNSRVYENDILIVITGNVGRCCIYKKNLPANVSQHVCIVRLKENNSDFVANQILSNKLQSQIKKIQSGGTREGLNFQQVASLKIKLPPLETQKKIAEYFTHLDNAITAQDLKLKSWRDAKKSLLQKIFSQEFYFTQDNGEKFPAWQEKNFDDLIIPKARIGWQNLRKDEYEKNSYAYLISGTDFKNGTVSTENIWQISKERYEMDKNIQVSAGDVLVTKDGTIGKVAIVPEFDRPAALNSHVYVFRTKENLIPKFLFCVLQSPIFKNFVEKIQAGTIFGSLAQKDLHNFKFKLPCVEEQKKIADHFSSLDKIIDAENKILENLRLVKKGLLQKLFV